MTTTLLLITIAAVAVLVATVRCYERITDNLRDEAADLRERLDAAQVFAEDSQVLLAAVIEEAQARERHPAGRRRPGLSLVQVMDA
jgi:hypothetical protein